MYKLYKLKTFILDQIEEADRHISDLREVLAFVDKLDVDRQDEYASNSNSVMPSIQAVLAGAVNAAEDADDERVHMDDYRNMQIQEALEELNATEDVNDDCAKQTADKDAEEEVNLCKVDMRTGTYTHTVYARLLKACKDEEWYTVKSLVNYTIRANNYAYVNSNRTAQALYTLWKNGYIKRRLVSGKKRLYEYSALKHKTFY